MTREEAIRYLGVHSSTNGSGLCTDEQHYEAKQVAIQALEQQPCEDAISRQPVLDEIPVLWNSNGDKDYCMESLRDFIAELPPVDTQYCDNCEVGNPCLYCKHEFEPQAESEDIL